MALGQRLAHVDAEILDVLAGARVDRAHQAVVEEYQAAVGAVVALPVIDAAAADPAGGLALPQLAAGGGIERGDLAVAGHDVHRAVYDDRIEHRRLALAGRILPGDLELVDVVPIDLGQRGE